MPTYGNQGNCSGVVIEVSIILYNKTSSNMANYSAWVTVVGSSYAFRIKCMCNGTCGTSHVRLRLDFFKFQRRLMVKCTASVLLKKVRQCDNFCSCLDTEPRFNCFSSFSDPYDKKHLENR